VLNAIPTGTLGFELGELAEVVAKAVDAAAIEAGTIMVVRSTGADPAPVPEADG